MRNLLSTLAILALLTQLNPARAQRLGPRALVVEPSFDFGYIPQDAKVSRTYWVDNLGTDTLVIFNIQPGCGCTKAPLTTFTAPPNDSLPIELVFDTGKRSRHQLKSTRITCNDPARSKFDLQLSAWVYKEEDSTGSIVFTKNEKLKFTTDDLGESDVVSFRNVSRQPLSVTLIDYPRELVSVEVPSGQIDPGDVGKIAVRVNSHLEKSDYQKSFTFELSDKARTRYSIPIRMAQSVKSLGRR